MNVTLRLSVRVHGSTVYVHWNGSWMPPIGWTSDGARMGSELMFGTRHKRVADAAQALLGRPNDTETWRRFRDALAQSDLIHDVAHALDELKRIVESRCLNVTVEVMQ